MDLQASLVLISFSILYVCPYLFYIHAAENTDTFWSRGILQ